MNAGILLWIMPSTILGQTAGSTVLKYLREPFVNSNDDSLDKRQFPLLHRIVLGLEPGKNLAQEFVGVTRQTWIAA
jgi:hypothetical protein